MENVRVVVGVASNREGDGLGEENRALIDCAVKLVRAQGGHLALVHVSEEELAADAPVRVAMQSELTSLRDQGIDGSLEVRTGRPWMALCDVVRGQEADLLLIAKRRHAGRGRHRLGPNTVKLLRSSPCSVWAVHNHAEGLPTKLLAAHDLTSTGTRATKVASTLAAAFEAKLVIAHIWQRNAELQAVARHMAKEAYDERINEHRAQLHDRVQAAVDAEPKPEVWMACDSPEHGLLNAIDSLNPDMVVMGIASRGGLAGFVVGNTAERLLPELECSVLVVRPVEEQD